MTTKSKLKSISLRMTATELANLKRAAKVADKSAQKFARAVLAEAAQKDPNR